MIFPFFHEFGKWPDFIADSKMLFNGGRIESPHNLIILIEILSWPCALFGFKSFIIIDQPEDEKVILAMRLLVL